MPKAQKDDKNNEKIAELTTDIQRVRADFENYRKRVETERQAARDYGQKEMIVKLLPVIDNIERAVDHVPAELADNAWAQGIVTLQKNLEKTLTSIGITKIDAQSGALFNPDLHHAVQFDEDSEGDQEVVADELQPGYMLDGHVLREAMVRVTRK